MSATAERAWHPSALLAAVPLAAIPLAMAGCGATEPVALESNELAPVSPLTERATRRALQMSPVPGPPADPTNRVFEDERAAELGRRLFHSKSLSKGGSISCATCHEPSASFVDGRTLAEGVLPLERHTPSLWNIAHSRWFFWDGRADSLWAQALVPLEDPLEHAFARTEVARAVYSDEELRRRYEAIFGPMAPFDDEERFPKFARPVPENDRAHELAREHRRRADEGDASAQPHHEHAGDSGFYHPHQRAWDRMSAADQELVNEVFVHVGKCIAAFQRRIVSDRAPFDEFVEGLRTGDEQKLEALTAEARRGFELFTGKAQCIVCHHGPLFTDFEFHDTLVPTIDGGPETDPGRARGLQSLLASEFGMQSRWSDDPDGAHVDKVRFLPRGDHWHGNSAEFKTPSLRNVALTAPYMHNGVFATLEEVVDFYSTRDSARDSTAPGETILQPLRLTDEERDDLVAFLESLTDNSLDLDRVAAPPSR